MFKRENIHEMLANVGYCSTDEIDTAVMMAMACGMPLLVEGDPGTGKSFLAKAISKAMGLEFIRLQMYDGLTDDKILYDYDYQRQLLSLEAIKPALEHSYAGLNVQQAIEKAAKEINFYGTEFLIERPVLKSISGKERCVLLIDELDKASEEVEYMFYEFLEDYSISIPQYGTVTCPPAMRPIVIITSNRYRELSGALKRRCAYLYLKRKTVDEMTQILIAQAGVDERVANGIAKCLDGASKLDLRQYPSIAEGINWGKYLSALDVIKKEDVVQSIGMIFKNHRDADKIRTLVIKEGESIWGGR